MMKGFKIKFVKSKDIFESDGECLVEIWNIKTGKGVARFVSKDEMRELLRKGKVKEFVRGLIKEVPSHDPGEAMLQTQLPVFTS